MSRNNKESLGVWFPDWLPAVIKPVKKIDWLKTPWHGLEKISPYAAEVLKKRHRRKGFISSCIEDWK